MGLRENEGKGIEGGQNIYTTLTRGAEQKRMVTQEWKRGVELRDDFLFLFFKIGSFCLLMVVT